MNKVWLFFVYIFLILSTSLIAQQVSVTGKVIDKQDNQPVLGVVMLLNAVADTNQVISVLTDSAGKFVFNAVPTGNYYLKSEYLGYTSIRMPIEIGVFNVQIPTIALLSDAKVLKEVKIEGIDIRSKQRNDTTEYNARAFKTNPDATAQDLISKMPGITTTNGTLQAQGEDVKKVLLDGKEFFGNDATMALRNLPADAIDKVQVFDRMTDQARFSGFNDGNTDKTINITTKPGMSNGQFGRLYAGYGTDERFSLGGNYNSFDKQRRISLVGQSNNINQQNFSAQDLSGITAGASGGGNNSGQPNGGRGMGGNNNRGNGGGPPNNSPANNFMVGQQGGINTTHAYGINYSDTWGKKITVAASYFFNTTTNATQAQTKRMYYLSDTTSQFLNQNSVSSSRTDNHRVNARLEYKLDSMNSILITPQFTYQTTNSKSITSGLSTMGLTELLSKTNNSYNTQSDAVNFSNAILYSHRFSKQGRTVSLNLGTTINTRDADNSLTALNKFYTTNDSTLLDQQTNNRTKGNIYTATLSYTEPIGKKGSVQVAYTPTFNNNTSNQQTNKYNPVSQSYTIVDSVLSNDFNNHLNTHAGGLTYRFKEKKYNFNFGANYQTVQLQSNQTFPTTLSVSKSFQSMLPSAMFQYTFENKSNLRMYYRTYTNAPSVTQLQNVINNSNPLALSTGNPNLVQEYNQFIMARYSYSKLETGTTFFMFVGGGAAVNYIANATSIASKDTMLTDQVLLRRGSQLTMPMNMQGAWNCRTFINYSQPIKKIKSNLNTNAGFIYNRNPGMINGAYNYLDNYTIVGGVSITSNISTKVDFTLSYNPTYVIAKNSIQAQLNNNYYYGNSSFKVNLLPWKGLVLTSDITNTRYQGLGAAYNQDFWLWNAAIGYKFLKAKQADLRLSVFDLLGQNNSANRLLTETYREDNVTKVLRRYFMLTFTYTFKKFPKAKVDENKKQ